MSGVATAIAVGSIGSTLISGSMQANAAEDAANIQAGATDRANQLQYQMFQEQQKLMQPWTQAGSQNLNRLNYALYGQLPSAQSMALDPASQEYKDWVAAHPQTPQQTASTMPFRFGEWTANLPATVNQAPAPTLYRNPFTGEITETPPDVTSQMGVQAGGLNPDWRFGVQDWKSSPEYQVYSGARDAAINRSQDALMAQGAASGMYGSGTMANALAQNMGQLYAQYDPQSLAAARQAAEAARTQEFNQLAGLSNPQGAQQVAQYAGQYGQNVGQNMIGAGNAQAAGQMGAANAWGNALTSGVNQLSNAYGQYQGQQNFNQPLPYLSTQFSPQGYGAPSLYQSQPASHQFTPRDAVYQV